MSDIWNPTSAEYRKPIHRDSERFRALHLFHNASQYCTMLHLLKGNRTLGDSGSVKVSLALTLNSKCGMAN